MGRALLVGRLAVRDLRRRPVEAALLLLAVMAATTTLTLGLVMRDVASDPYQSTREATAGPDVIGLVLGPEGLPRLEELAGEPGVVDSSGPYPVAPAELRAGGLTSDVQVVGRDAAPASVDRPQLREGRWVGDGGAVLEAAFAEALGVGVGDPVTLNGRSFTVAGVAVTAAMPPYPASRCLVVVGCLNGSGRDAPELPPEVLRNPGLVWLTQADVRSLADPGPLSYLMNLRLEDPAAAKAFVDAHISETRDDLGVISWEEILGEATELARDAQIVLLIGAWLLGLLAVASLSVMVGGRMADQTRRVGLLKAAGGTPGLVAAVLLAEYVVVAVVAAVAGLAVGVLTAPLLTETSAGLVGAASPPSLTAGTVGVVFAAALVVAVVATLVPAVRAARRSTVDALADSARPPSRVGWLIAVSARLPVPLLLALRVAARRPRRAVLGVAGFAIMVSGIYVALILDGFLRTASPYGGLGDTQVEQLRQVLLVWTVVLLGLTAVNAVFVTWATVLDNRHASALARALGATPGEVSAGLSAAQVLPAFVGAVLGVFPGGWLLFAAIVAITGGERDEATLPALWQLVSLVLATVVVVAALTAVPSRLGGRRPVTGSLQSGLG
jgi:ABC-type lipoprotein release transport system permease subunit